MCSSVSGGTDSWAHNDTPSQALAPTWPSCQVSIGQARPTSGCHARTIVSLPTSSTGQGPTHGVAQVGQRSSVLTDDPDNHLLRLPEVREYALGIMIRLDAARGPTQGTDGGLHPAPLATEPSTKGI